MTGALRIVEGAEAARQSVLRREPLRNPALPEPVRATIRETFGADLSAGEVVTRIIDDVRREGDAAVTRYSQRFDRSSYSALEVSGEEIEAARREVPADVMEAMRFAVDRLQRFHRTQAEHGPRPFTEHGVGMIVRPLQRAGVYMTGAESALPSSVIHTVVPGAVAGVEEIIGVTAARADGSVHPLKLVAAELAGVHRIFRASGAQAIAALAFGTETIPRVDKVFGPGGVFVTLAKQQLYGTVGIDALYGPTETLVLADEDAAPDLCAADLLAQAAEVERQLEHLERSAIARAAIERGGAVVVADLDEAIELANEFAPEHLCLLTANPGALASRVRNVGGIFIGEHSPEALGDYVAGPSHVMPTGGTARFASPLSVYDFLKTISTVEFSQAELRRTGVHAAVLARAEGLTGHARSIELRLEGR